MPELARFRCLNCGERFSTEVLNERELEDLHREGRRGGAIRCPSCNRTDVRDGWE